MKNFKSNLNLNNNSIYMYLQMYSVRNLISIIYIFNVVFHFNKNYLNNLDLILMKYILETRFI